MPGRAEFAAGNQFNLLALQYFFGLGRGQNCQLIFARVAQAGFNAIKLGIVVSRVADELPRALRQVLDQLTKRLQSKAASRDDAYAAVRRNHSEFFQCISKAGPERTQNSQLKAPLPVFRSGEDQRLERVSYRRDTAIPSRA